jgi:hypothetical protein
MSDANRSSLAFQRETSWGVNPVSPALKLQRLTSESLMHAKDTVVSEEVRSDRQVSDLVEVGAAASGAVNFELSYSDFKHWLEAVLMSNIVTVNITGLSASAVLATQKLTGSAGDFNAVQAGSWVKVTGFTTAANNGIKLVTAKASNGSDITLAANSITADESASIAITGQYVTNGETRHSYVFERGLRDYNNTLTYQVFRGCSPDQMQVSFESKKIITGSLSFIGKVGESASSSIMAATGVSASGTLTFSNTGTNDDTITIGARVYTLKTALSSGPTVANEVLIGVSAAATRNNLVAAINGAAGEGTTYSVGTLAHALVTAAASSTAAIIVTAISHGTAGNSLATTDTSSHAAWGAATLSGGTDDTAYTAASTDPVMNATSNVGRIIRDDATMSERMKSMSFTIANGLRGKDAMGERGNFDIGVGDFNLSGSFSAYFRDNALFAAHIAHSDLKLGWSVTSGSGATIGFYVPRVKLSDANPPIPGRNQDVMSQVEWQATIENTIGKTLIVSFIDP